MEAKYDSKLYDHPLTKKVIGCAIEVHRHLGPGLLETTYQRCLKKELSLNGIHFENEYPLPVHYKGEKLDCGYRVDLMVEDLIVVELKAVDQISRIHQAQLLTYMKLAEMPIGLLLNFNVGLLKDGINKFVL